MATIDGKKTGGRQKGMPNRIPALVRGSIARVLEKYYADTGELKAASGDEIALSFENDVRQLGPRERILAMERYVGYVTPKLQTTTLEMAAESRKTIEDRLIELSEEKKSI